MNVIIIVDDRREKKYSNFLQNRKRKVGCQQFNDIIRMIYLNIIILLWYSFKNVWQIWLVTVIDRLTYNKLYNLFQCIKINWITKNHTKLRVFGFLRCLWTQVHFIISFIISWYCARFAWQLWSSEHSSVEWFPCTL